MLPTREVVLVDDDPGFVETLGALLRFEGYSVVTELTFSAALQYLSRHKADVLITDVSLGAKTGNGWQLAKYATRHQPGLRVIVVTALADHLDADIEYWRLPVFLKPFDPDQLLEHLRSDQGHE
ncbi:MAG: response regulator [Vicinamibacterales bacterium]